MKVYEIEVVDQIDGEKVYKFDVILDMKENGWVEGENIVLTGDRVGEYVSEEQKSRQKRDFIYRYSGVLTDETLEHIEREYIEIEAGDGGDPAIIKRRQ